VRRPFVCAAPAALAALFLTQPAAAQPTHQRVAQMRRVLDSLATDFAATDRVPGAAIAVVRGRDTLLWKAYGSANLEQAVPMSVRSVFRVGSITKQFTSAAILQLVQEGTLAVSDSVGHWLPDLPAAWRPVTISQLLNHTSGIPSYTDAGEPWFRRHGEDLTAAQLLAFTADKAADFTPGSSWRYNNTGYVLLGMVIEARSGRRWSDELARRLFEPLQMKSTRYCDNRPLIANRASGYSRDERDSWLNAAYLSMTHPHAAGAICSTVGDLLLWNRALHNGKVMSASNYALMTTPTGPAVAQRYAAGIARDDLGSHAVLIHGGGINGFAAANLFVPDAQLSVSVLTNGDFSNPDGVAKQLARAALGIPLDAPPKGIRVSAAVLRTYQGAFDLMLDGPHIATVFEKDGALYSMLDNQTPEKLIPLGNHTFGAYWDSTVRFVFSMENNRSVTFVFKARGKDFLATRRP
jgi:D-alanyl-D-alanine carboxypeptidase